MRRALIIDALVASALLLAPIMACAAFTTAKSSTSAKKTTPRKSAPTVKPGPAATPAPFSEPTAPKQTAEGAREFIRLTLADGFYYNDIPSIREKFRRGYDDDEAYIAYFDKANRMYKVTSIKWPGPCTLITTVHRDSGSVTDDLNDNTGRARNFYVKAADFDFVVDWTKVHTVRSGGQRVTISIVGAGMPLLYDVSSETIATRMAFAMEFVRLSCDKGAATGF